jgi:serine/threonine-protein kinase
MVMVYVPKGIFTMGSNFGDPDEQPVRDVYMDAFWIDQTEVTYSMFSHFAPARSGRYPVNNVSWEQAAAYCAWVGGRLPTEAEWEKAARGPEERTYPWGNQLPAGDLANFADLRSRLNWEDTSVDDGYGNTAPVGSYPAGASLYGALDMAGNVAEWVNDWYSETYYSTAPLINPPGPAEGDYRVIRGGSWYSTAAGVRSADRAWYIPEGGTDYTGFRCAQSIVAP